MKSIKNKILTTMSKLMVVALAVSVVNIQPTKVNAATNGVSLSVTGDAKKVGNIVTIDVKADNVAGVYGASVDFKFDSNVFDVTSITQGAAISTLANIPVTSKAGEKSVVASLKGNASTVTANGTIATITAKVKVAQTKDTTIKVTNNYQSAVNNDVIVKLADANSAAINYTGVGSTAVIGGNIVTPPVEETSKIVSFKADKASGQKVGTTIGFTLDATPATSTNYCFYVREGVGPWSNMQTWSKNNKFSWTPSKSGVYRIRGFVKNDKSTAVNDGYQDIIFVVKDNVSTPVISKLTSFTATPSTGAVNTKTNFAATADPASKALYSFYVKAPGATSWERIQDYSFKNNFDYTPTVAGTYTVRVHCWNINSNNPSTDGYRDLVYTVK